MNAITPIGAASPTEARCVKTEAHLFRSRVIDKFATFERWAAERIRAADANTKMPHLLGLKLEEVRRVAKQHPKLFKNVSVVENLLDRVQSHLKVRSAVAHSTLRLSGNMIMFEHAEAKGPPGLEGRLALQISELDELHADLSRIVNELNQQTQT